MMCSAFTPDQCLFKAITLNLKKPVLNRLSSWPNTFHCGGAAPPRVASLDVVDVVVVNRLILVGLLLLLVLVDVVGRRL